MNINETFWLGQVFDAWNQLAWDTVIGPTFLGRTNALHSESEVTE